MNYSHFSKDDAVLAADTMAETWGGRGSVHAKQEVDAATADAAAADIIDMAAARSRLGKSV